MSDLHVSQTDAPSPAGVPTAAAAEPIPVLLRGRRVLVVGGGGAALGVVGRLLRADAHVTLAAEHLDAALEDLVDRGLVDWARTGYEPALLLRAAAVCAATGEADLDAGVIADADDAGLILIPATVGAERRRGPGGTVVLVGGGPGHPGLITVAGREAVLTADVVVVDRLAPIALLEELGPDVEVVDVSKIPRGRFTPQEEINQILIDRARAGLRVARLKGGDSYVFGRGMEEHIACEGAGIPVEVVPGVTSAVSAPELAGIPVTHRGMVQGFAVVSGHAAPDDPRSTVDWAALGRSGVSIVVLMGVETLPRIARALIDAGRAAETPMASVMDAALPSQRVYASTLGEIALGAPAEITAPAVTVIGDVATFAAAGARVGA